MKKPIVQRRIDSAKAAVVKLLEDFHYERVSGEDVEIQLGYVRNQLDIIIDDLEEC